MFILDIILLFIGFFILVKGADYFVDGCSNLAKSFGIPTLIIGLTIVAFGTSAPECAVSVIASLKGNSAISMGNVVGSNICNLLLVLGVTGLFGKLVCKKKIIERDYTYSIMSYITLLIMTISPVINHLKNGVITRTYGALLLCFLIIYVYSLVIEAKQSIKEKESVEKKKFTFKDFLCIILGLAAIICGGELVVNMASNIAEFIGISDRVIALTVVAFGTSLPELVTCIIAVKKGENDIAIGNIIGSNIFNIFMILGLSSLVNPVTYGLSTVVDIVVMLASGLLVLAILSISKKIAKKEGIIMLLAYIAYLIYLFIK